MLRRLAVLALATAIASLAFAGPAAARIIGVVGPGSTIILKNGAGQRITQLHRGQRTFRIRDRSSFHNFHLAGPGVDKKTGVAFTGRRRWSLTLKTGNYDYRCDRHPFTMTGSFRVVS